ncbi:MAG: carbohydrate ABC transporter permease [Chloroflexi bacterium]|nr:carbohydrate ABC transporter permease [Chloroflexota bacterium]
MTTLTQEQLDQAKRQEQIYRVRQLISKTIDYGFMTFLGIFFLFPIVFMVVASLKPARQIFADLKSIWAFVPRPDTLTLASYETVFDQVPFERYAFNSIFLTLVIVITGLFVNSMAAFVLARLRWPGRQLVLGIVVSLIIIPLEAIAVPLLMQVSNQMTTALDLLVTLTLVGTSAMLWIILWGASYGVIQSRPSLQNLPVPAQWWLRGIFVVLLSLPFEALLYLLYFQVMGDDKWFDSYHVQIVPFIAEPFSIFLFYQFFIGIPKDFDEAAYVDGAGPFRIFWQVIVPLSRPVFATLAILKFLQFWAFYLWPLQVTVSQKYYPLMVGMDTFNLLYTGEQEPPIGRLMAYASLVTVPVLITFLIFQRWFVQSVSSSGVKG